MTQNTKASSNLQIIKQEGILRQKVDQVIKKFVREIKKLYWKHQNQYMHKDDTDQHVRTNINGLNSKQLYKMLCIMIKPHRDISEEVDINNQIINQQKMNENSCSYNYNYHETQNEQQYQFQQENIQQSKNNQVYVIPDQIPTPQKKQQFQYVQKIIEKEKNEKKTKPSNLNQPEKRIQYYITNQSEQHLIVDACTRYFESKNSLSRTQISIIARKIVNREIFKASDKWVKRFLTKYPQLKKCFPGQNNQNKIAKKTSEKIPNKDKSKGQVSDDDNDSSKKWDDKQVLQNIKKAFKQKNNR